MYVSQLVSVTEKLSHAAYKLKLELEDGRHESIITASLEVLDVIKEYAPTREDSTQLIRTYAENLKRGGSHELSRLIISLIQGRFSENPRTFIDRNLNIIRADLRKPNKRSFAGEFC